MGLVIKDITPATELQGGRVAKIVEFTLDTDYAAGGYAVTAAHLGLSTVHRVAVSSTSGFVPEYDLANHKLKVLFGDNNNAADGPLIEVADGADAIAGLTCRAEVTGIL